MANEASRVEPAAVSRQATAPSGQAIGYASPLNIPLRLSANYGELRGGHFHAGIDIKTQGVIGKPVFAMDDGYVSRINVSPSGFGKALYITHPDGRMTVYGHLERFTEPIEAYVHELQYARKTFAIDFAPPETRFPVKRGERIGLSGNRGSSGGPHLHLEVREGAAQRPLNVLARGFLKVPDTIPPVVKKLYYVSVDTVQGIPLHTVRLSLPVGRMASGGYALSDTVPLPVTASGYFAVEAEEKKNGTSNPMGIYEAEVSKDGEPCFSMTVDRIGFELGRYSYAVALYPESRGTRNGVYRLCALPNNPLPIYGKDARRGMLSFEEGRTHRMEITLGDDCKTARRSRSTSASLRRTERTRNKTGPRASRCAGTATTATEAKASGSPFPGSALRVDSAAHANQTPTRLRILSAVYGPHAGRAAAQEHPDQHRRIRAARASAKQGPDRLGRRRRAAQLGRRFVERGQGEHRHPLFRNVLHSRRHRSAPHSSCLQGRRRLRVEETIAVKISDDFSGIGSYSATIDGQWALFELDAKTGTLTHYFDDKRWEKGKTHELVLTVTDNKETGPSTKELQAVAARPAGKRREVGRLTATDERIKRRLPVPPGRVSRFRDRGREVGAEPSKQCSA
ncbi:MAG: M23 family metallopeptidase [Alistipes sp.]